MEWDDQDFKEWEYKDETSGTSKLQQRCSLVEVDTLARSRGGRRSTLGSWAPSVHTPGLWRLRVDEQLAGNQSFVLYWRPDSWAPFREHLRVCLPGYGFGPADFLQVGDESLEAIAFPFPSPLHNHSQKFPLEAWSNTINMSFVSLYFEEIGPHLGLVQCGQKSKRKYTKEKRQEFCLFLCKYF